MHITKLFSFILFLFQYQYYYLHYKRIKNVEAYQEINYIFMLLLIGNFSLKYY